MSNMYKSPLTDTPPIQLQIYRTDDALFVYHPSMAAEAFKKGIRFIPYVLLFAAFLFGAIILRDGNKVDVAIGLCAEILGIVVLLWGLYILPQAPNDLLRIDSVHIAATSWCFGWRTTKVFNRPDKLAFEKIETAKGRWVFKDLKGYNFAAQTHEIVWLQKVLQDFSTGLALPLRTPNKKPPKETSKALRSVLATMEYNGKPLKRVPHPSEQCDTEAHSSSSGLFVRCPACHSALPKKNVWFDETAGQCPHCKLVFQIDELKSAAPPKRNHIHFTEDETGLHLHQRPKHINVFTCYFSTFPLFPLVMILPYWSTLIKADRELLTAVFLPVGIILGIMLLILLFLIPTYHVHRYVNFEKEMIRFRIRWIFWSCRWSFNRSAMRAFHTPFLQLLFGGVILPYGKKSFYLSATDAEQAYLTSTVYRWLWQNPPSGSHPEEEKTSELFIGGLGAAESTWQMFCPHCGRQFTGDENNLQDRETGIHCPDCGQVFTASSMRRFVLERIPGLSDEDQYALPVYSGLQTEQMQDHLKIEYTPSPTWTSTVKYYSGMVFPLLLTVFFSTFIPVLFWCDGRDFVTILSLFLFFLYGFGYMYPMFFQVMLLNYNSYRSLFSGWSISMDKNRFVIHRRYKMEHWTVSYDRAEILQLRQTKCWKSFLGSAHSPLWGKFPSVLSNSGFGGIELVLRNGTVEHLPCLPFRQETRRQDEQATRRWVNEMNRFLARM